MPGVTGANGLPGQVSLTPPFPPESNLDLDLDFGLLAAVVGGVGWSPGLNVTDAKRSKSI